MLVACCSCWGPSRRSSCRPSGASPRANVTADARHDPAARAEVRQLLRARPLGDARPPAGPRTGACSTSAAPAGARPRSCGPGGASWITGIEMLPEPAAIAERVYDQVLVGDAIQELPERRGPVRHDPLLRRARAPVRPARARAGLRTAAAPGARLHVSVPNASHISLLRDLILRGTFGYEPAGHRDATHIRWFTRRDIVALIGEAGWQVQSVANSQLHLSRPAAPADARALDRVPGRAVVRAGARPAMSPPARR